MHYLIAQIDIHDPALFAEYGAAVGPQIAAHGGKYLVRGGAADAREGAPFKRLVVIEFPDEAAAKAFYDAPEYQPLKAMRERASTADLALVAGA